MYKKKISKYKWHGPQSSSKLFVTLAVIFIWKRLVTISPLKTQRLLTLTTRSTENVLISKYIKSLNQFLYIKMIK